jgi:O-antigen/teichoic acid export membrane protein
VSALTLAVGVISLACDLILIPRLGVHGAVISTVVTYALSIVGNGAMALRISWRLRNAPDACTP